MRNAEWGLIWIRKGIQLSVYICNCACILATHAFWFYLYILSRSCKLLLCRDPVKIYLSCPRLKQNANQFLKYIVIICCVSDVNHLNLWWEIETSQILWNRRPISFVRIFSLTSSQHQNYFLNWLQDTFLKLINIKLLKAIKSFRAK